MTRNMRSVGCVWLILACAATLAAEEATPSTLQIVPQLVNFNGVLTDVNGKPLTGVVGVTFALYKEQQGGAPLWLETQNVQPGKDGHYSVILGSASSHGLPADIFTSGEAHWLSVQVQGQAEQARVLLVSVPYALKAGDAATIGGLPASAFVLLAAPSANSATAATGSESSNPIAPQASSNVTTGGGTVNALPLFTTATNIQSSAITQTGTGASAKVGIGTTTPASMLDVKGAATVRGLFSLPAMGTATATAGFKSQPMDFITSAFSGTTHTAVAQTFQWQAEPVGNNTTSATGSLNLLFAHGTSALTETGLKIASTGQITFAHGQLFPGTGTITGVTAGTDLTGGGNSGAVTLNLDTTKIPRLANANSFTAAQSITNNAANADALTITNNAVSGAGMVLNANSIGVYATANSVGATGVFGANTASTGNGIGVQGFSVGGTGIYGSTSGISGLFNGAAAVV